MKRFLIPVIFLLIVVVIGVTLIPTDRNQIKKVLGSCKVALVNRDISGFMQSLSFNYSDDYGNSYLLLKKRLEKLLERFSDFDISTDIMLMEIDKNRAEVDLKVSVIAKEGDDRRYLIGDADWPQDIKVYLEKTHSLQWKILKIERFDQLRKNDD